MGFSTGQKITIKNAPYYVSSTSSRSLGTKSGTFYIWSAATANGRIRITSQKSYAGKNPASKYVTCWIKTSSINGSGNTSTKKTSTAAATKKTTSASSSKSTYSLSTPVITVSNVSNGIKISWGKISGAAKYRVFRKNGNSWQRIAETTGTSYVDTNVVAGKSYTYTVRCISADGKQYTSLYDTSGKTITAVKPKITTNIVEASNVTPTTVAPGQIGYLGMVLFIVSPTTLQTLKDFQMKVSAKYQEHDRHLAIPTVEFTGVNSREITFNMEIIRYLNSDPKKQFDLLTKYCENGIAIPFKLGGVQYGRYRWCIKAATLSGGQTDKRGRWTTATVSVTLLSVEKKG